MQSVQRTTSQALAHQCRKPKLLVRSVRCCSLPMRMRGVRPLSTKGSASTASPWGGGSRMLQTVDVHCAGEPARVVVGGLPGVQGRNATEQRTYCMEHLDHIRQLMLHEPRGYPCQNVDYVLPSQRPEASYAVVIAEQGGIYPAMSGHNIMCVATALLETGMVPMSTTRPTVNFTLDTPGGLVPIEAECESDKVRSVTLHNVASFVEHLDLQVQVPELGVVAVDVAYGGMWYAIVRAEDVGLTLQPEHGKALVRYGEMIKAACREQYPVQHPSFDYPGVDILCFRSAAHQDPDDSSVVRARNTVVMSNGVLDWSRPETWTGMLDRSPCGTGTSAVMSVMEARGELRMGQTLHHESILGTQFQGKLLQKTVVHGTAQGAGESVSRQAFMPSITGRAWITQYSQVVVDPTDPFPHGYTVGDIW